MKRCERLGCQTQFEVRVASAGRPRRFCSDACSQRERRRNAPRPALLPPLPPPAGWYPRPTTPPAWPPTPRLTRREALERWAEMVTDATNRAAQPIHETDAHATGDAIQSAHGHERDSASHRAGHERDSASHRTHKNQPTNTSTPKTGQGE